MKVQDVMTKHVFCCVPTDTIQTTAQLMKKHNVGAIPIVDDCTSKHLEGIVTDRDIALRAAAEGKDPVKTVVGDVMTRTLFTCKPDDRLDDCEKLMSSRQIRRVPVVGKNGECLGMVTQADVVLHDVSGEKISKMLSAISKPGRPEFAAA